MADDDVAGRLKREVEAACGGEAELEQVVPVEERMQDGESFWQAQVHVFRTGGAGVDAVCYAWMQPSPNGDGEVPVVVPGSEDVGGPEAAVRTRIRREVDEAGED